MATNKIDTNVWVTQASLAKELGVKVQCIHNWIGRGKINAKKIEGSRLVLVDKTSANTTDLRKNKTNV